MRISKDKRALLKQFVRAAYAKGITTPAAVAEDVGISESAARTYMREMGLYQPRKGPTPARMRRSLLTPAEMQQLFDGLPLDSDNRTELLLATRVRARELFGLELLDTTTYRWITSERLRARLIDESAPTRRGTSTTVQRRVQALAALSKTNGYEGLLRDVLRFKNALERIAGRKFSRPSAYNYMNKVEEYLKRENE